MTVVPFRTVKVSLPSPTVPAELVTVAVSVTAWAELLYVIVTLLAAVVVAAAPIVSVCELSLDVPKSVPPR